MFKWLFRSRKATTRPEPSQPMASSDPSVLLKQATSLKREGDLDAAILTLRRAYEQIANGNTAYGVDTFLRLPLYLQACGKNDEAWSEFNRLIVEGYPNQLSDLGVQAMEHSKVYDKMRLFLQREGKKEHAVVFGCLSMLAWAKGLHLQSRKEEFGEFISTEGIRSTLGPLLKKANMDQYSGQLVELILAEVKVPSRINLSDAASRISALVNRVM